MVSSGTQTETEPCCAMLRDSSAQCMPQAAHKLTTKHQWKCNICDGGCGMATPNSHAQNLPPLTPNAQCFGYASPICWYKSPECPVATSTCTFCRCIGHFRQCCRTRQKAMELANHTNMQVNGKHFWPVQQLHASLCTPQAMLTPEPLTSAPGMKKQHHKNAHGPTKPASSVGGALPTSEVAPPCSEAQLSSSGTPMVQKVQLLSTGTSMVCKAQPRSAGIPQDTAQLAHTGIPRENKDQSHSTGILPQKKPGLTLENCPSQHEDGLLSTSIAKMEIVKDMGPPQQLLTYRDHKNTLFPTVVCPCPDQAIFSSFPEYVSVRTQSEIIARRVLKTILS